MHFNRTILVLSTLSVLICSCVDKAAEETRKKRRAVAAAMQQQPFSELMEAFDRVGEFPSYVVLDNYDSVRILYENPDFFVDSVVNYLGGDHSLVQKEIANYIVRGLPEEQFIAYIDRVAGLYKDGKIQNQLMSHILFPPESSNHILVENYKEPKVKSILMKVKDNPRANGSLRTQIERVLAGDGY